MVVRRRARDPGGLGKLGECRVAAREHGAACGSRPSSPSARPSRSARSSSPSSSRTRIADDPRATVLAEQEPRARGEVRNEHDAIELGLGLVAVAAGGDARSARAASSASRRFASASRASSAIAAGSNTSSRERLEDGEHAPLRLGGRERQQQLERFARLRRRSSARGRGARGSPRRGPPRAPRAPTTVRQAGTCTPTRCRRSSAAAVARTAATTSSGGSSARPSRWSHSSARCACRRARPLAQRRAAAGELRHPAAPGHGAVGPGERREADQELERRLRQRPRPAAVAQRRSHRVRILSYSFDYSRTIAAREDAMRYRLLGRSGLRVSELGLGTMTFGTDWGWGADEAECAPDRRARSPRPAATSSTPRTTTPTARASGSSAS